MSSDHAAILLTVTPDAVVKSPPAKTVSSEETAKASTVLSMPVPRADQGPFDHAAILFTVTPDAVVKDPPA